LRLASREHFDKYQKVSGDVEALIMELKKEEAVEKDVDTNIEEEGETEQDK
jgi:uncharacterized protein YaaN involved in tellurite resistance